MSPLSTKPTRHGGLGRWLWFPLLVAVLVPLGIAADWWFALPEDAQATFVGRDTCARCHEKQFQAWRGSDHDLAMDLATEQSVLGNFDNQTFSYQGVTSRMFRRGEKFFIHTEGPTGKMEDFEIKYTFGVRPLQQYMVEFPDGRVQVLRVSWDTEKKRWFYVPPPDVLDEKLEPGDPLHWTGAAQNWNHTCAECHSTNLQKNFDLAANRYHTTFSEIDVSCEACHGPGSLHVELAESHSLFWDRRRGFGLARLKGKDPEAELETCAKCHSRRGAVHPDFSPGSELLDYYEPSLLHESLYHSDGQILDEVYVYGSFLQSKMYHQGIRCTDCHDPHSTRVKFSGNKLCTQCHKPGVYDTPAHHHHAVDSVGASCVACHMPERTYMVVDPRRDHSLRVPRPDLSVALGTPNACNDCHTKPEEDAAWAAATVKTWYGDKRPDDPHFAPALAAGRRGDPEGEQMLLHVIARPRTPPIVRATAVGLLARYSSVASEKARQQALADPSPLVRLAAVRSLGPTPPAQLLRLLSPRLTDPVRAVRAAAARRLVEVPAGLLVDAEREAMIRGLKEFEAAQQIDSDRGASHLVLASLYQQQGDLERAAESLRTAIRLEPYLTGARSNLAALYTQLGKPPQEIQKLRQQEADLLARHTRMVPDDAGLKVDYAVMLYLLDRSDEAIEQLEAACRLDPWSFDFRVLLTELYIKQGRRQDAEASVDRLAEMRPGDSTTLQLRQTIQRLPPLE